MRIKLTYRMRMKRFYRIVADKLKKKGVVAFMMRPYQLAFTRKSRMGGGWLTFYKERWYFATWEPRLYLIHKKRDIPALCKDFLYYKGSAMPEELAAKYHLQEIPDAEMEPIFNDLYGGW
jgi:hypothetical protein